MLKRELTEVEARLKEMVLRGFLWWEPLCIRCGHQQLMGYGVCFDGAQLCLPCVKKVLDGEPTAALAEIRAVEVVVGKAAGEDDPKPAVAAKEEEEEEDMTPIFTLFD